MKKRIVVKLEIGITTELERRFAEQLEMEAAGSGRADAKELRCSVESINRGEWDELAKASFPYFIASLAGFQEIGGPGKEGSLYTAGLEEDYQK